MTDYDPDEIEALLDDLRKTDEDRSNRTDEELSGEDDDRLLNLVRPHSDTAVADAVQQIQPHSGLQQIGVRRRLALLQALDVELEERKRHVGLLQSVLQSYRQRHRQTLEDASSSVNSKLAQLGERDPGQPRDVESVTAEDLRQIEVRDQSIESMRDVTVLAVWAATSGVGRDAALDAFRETMRFERDAVSGVVAAGRVIGRSSTNQVISEEDRALEHFGKIFDSVSGPLKE